MKKYKFIGLFKSDNQNTYELEVYCNGYIQAFILLTAKAIESGNHYQLFTITNEDGDYRTISNINELIRSIILDI